MRLDDSDIKAQLLRLWGASTVAARRDKATIASSFLFCMQQGVIYKQAKGDWQPKKAKTRTV